MLKHIINKEEFETAIKEKPTVLVDFFAHWCGPCNSLSPIVEKVAETHPEIDVIKVDVDQAPELAAKYGVSSIPMLLSFENGTQKDVRVGWMPEASLLRFLHL